MNHRSQRVGQVSPGRADHEEQVVGVETLWRDLVTAALLGSDRREPPDPGGPIGDLVADAVRDDASSRMLATVAACVTVRRAGVRPGSPTEPLGPPDHDDRPPCTPAAVARWYHITTSWPVLEDEWILTCIEQGWRVAPELVPPLLRRHRRHAVRRARAVVAVGPTAVWLAGHVPDLGAADRIGSLTAAEVERLGELPDLPIPPELAGLLDSTGSEVGGAIAIGIENGTFAEPHRAVLVNLLARCVPGGLGDVADVLDAVDRRSSGLALAISLGDLATTRARMLDELSSR